MNNLGEWVNNIDYLHHEFNTNTPYPHVVINNFLKNNIADELSEIFPNINSLHWNKYNNPFENKYISNDINSLPVIYKNLFTFLNTSEFILLIRKITNINNLENDPLLHGAGLHYYPNNGKLDLHLDYSLHPVLNKERRINLIIYLNKYFEESWGGQLQLSSSDIRYCKKITPLFNSAILFQTSDISIHGVPDVINCPKDQGRKSINIFYLSEPRENIIIRKKAEFLEIPNEEYQEQKNKLRSIRKERVLTDEDIKIHFPEWKPYLD